MRIDLLVKNRNRFELIEVKAKSYSSKASDIESLHAGISSRMLEYMLAYGNGGPGMAR